MWTCPICHHRFVTPNMWHSCTNYGLEHHFEGASPKVRETYDRFLAVIEEFGPVTVIPQKTRISIMVKVRFAGCIVRKKWLLANLWLTCRAEHQKLQRTEKFGPTSYGLQFRFDSPDDMDDEFRQLVRESYAVGRREHLRRPNRTSR